jgi:hypothetical protein
MSMEWTGIYGCRSGAALGAAEPRLAIHRGAHTICQVIQISSRGSRPATSVYRARQVRVDVTA